ncbi:MAG: hypothetical protein AAF184_11630 [Pseudomonadota bacterium]
MERAAVEQDDSPCASPAHCVVRLVATVYMVPTVVECVDERESLRMQLTFSGEEPRRIELLCRKFSQLTETIGLEVEHA